MFNIIMNIYIIYIHLYISYLNIIIVQQQIQKNGFTYTHQRAEILMN